MPRYQPILKASDLPLPNDASRESDVFDCKARYADKKVPFEVAKDVAAMANRLGGTILVGLKEDRQAYVPFDLRSEADTFAMLVDRGVKERCSPRPVVGREVLPHGKGFVVAVNVEPFIGVIGVTVLQADRSAKLKAHFRGESFVFPIRAGSQTDYLTPETLPMYMMPEVRRTVLFLTAASGTRDVLVYPGTSPEAPSSVTTRTPLRGVIDEVCVELNRFKVSMEWGRGTCFLYLPIDQVAAGWEHARGWRFFMRGIFVGKIPDVEYIPALGAGHRLQRLLPKAAWSQSRAPRTPRSAGRSTRATGRRRGSALLRASSRLENDPPSNQLSSYVGDPVLDARLVLGRAHPPQMVAQAQEQRGGR